MAECAIIVHSLQEARAAVCAAAEHAVPVTLASAPGAAGYVGALWFREVVAQAAAERPEVTVSAVLDCGDKPGLVLAALRQGLKRVRFTGRRSTAEALAAIARQYRADLVTGALPARDLLDEPDAVAACRRWLAPR